MGKIVMFDYDQLLDFKKQLEEKKKFLENEKVKDENISLDIEIARMEGKIEVVEGIFLNSKGNWVDTPKD